jgi:4-hydroxybenzoate polyprenyltransferase
MDRKIRRAFGLSLVAIVIFMSHFWWAGTIASVVQWWVAGACAVASIYYGIAMRGKSEEATKWVLDAAFVIGCIVLIGLAISAPMLIVPTRLHL